MAGSGACQAGGIGLPLPFLCLCFFLLPGLVWPDMVQQVALVHACIFSSRHALSSRVHNASHGARLRMRMSETGNHHSTAVGFEIDTNQRLGMVFAMRDIS